MNVKILGSGCAKCNQLEKNTLTALNEMNIKADVEHVTDFAKIAAYGVMATPALMLDDKVISMGRVLTVEDIKNIISK